MQTTTFNTQVRYDGGFTYQVTEMIIQHIVGNARGKEHKKYYVAVLLSDATHIYTTPLFTTEEKALIKAQQFVKFSPGYLFERTEQGGYKFTVKERKNRKYFRIRDDKSGMEEV